MSASQQKRNRELHATIERLERERDAYRESLNAEIAKSNSVVAYLKQRVEAAEAEASRTLEDASRLEQERSETANHVHELESELAACREDDANECADALKAVLAAGGDCGKCSLPSREIGRADCCRANELRAEKAESALAVVRADRDGLIDERESLKKDLDESKTGCQYERMMRQKAESDAASWRKRISEITLCFAGEDGPESITESIRQLQANAAAMRGALEMMCVDVDDGPCVEGCPAYVINGKVEHSSRCRIVRAALSSSAGNALLEELEQLRNTEHPKCGSCGSETQPDIHVCPKCYDAWIGGKGCEFLDKVTAPLRAKCARLDASRRRWFERWRDQDTRFADEYQRLWHREAARVKELEMALAEAEPLLRASENGWHACRWCGKCSADKPHEPDCGWVAEVNSIGELKVRIRALLSKPTQPTQPPKYCQHTNPRTATGELCWDCGLPLPPHGKEKKP